MRPARPALAPDVAAGNAGRDRRITFQSRLTRWGGLGLAGLLSACATAPADVTTAAAAAPAAPAAAASSAAATQTPPARPAPLLRNSRIAAAAAALNAKPSAAAAGRPTGSTTPEATPGGPPPFATVIRGATRHDGPLVLWQREDKVWIELRPEQLGQPFLLSPKIKSGIGEAWVLGGLMAFPVNGAGGPQAVEFVRVHNQVRLQARNTEVLATAGSPEARAVADSYAASLVGASGVVSQPHPDHKGILIEANPIFLSDMLGIGMMLQRGLRQGYGLDRGNSVITAVRSTPQAVVLETQNHFFTGGLSTPNPAAPPNAPVPVVPRYLPDARSMLVSLNYSLAPLPKEPMAQRLADPRVGLFTTTQLDFSDELSPSLRKRVVNRWRLEKKDPAAAMSPPVKPITFWIDRNVPLAYRETVRAAILEWNRAFEKIGFQGAIDVQQQPDDAAFDTLDFGYPSVRWMMNAEPQFSAIGPSHVDPRTGEILDADIAFEGLAARGVRNVRTQVLSSGSNAAASGSTGFAQPFILPGIPGASGLTGLESNPAAGPDIALHAHGAYCLHGALAAEQMGYALDVLQARGELEPDSPVARQFVQDYVKEAIMHEVGHTLGLRHNFRASRAYTEAQLADPEFTRANGTTGSVMEYNAVNLPRPGERAGVPFQTALGPYDFWAIEYAYKPLPPGTTPEAERAALQAVAARSSEPLLAFGTDEDNAIGLDPETLQLDLGNDPIAFAAKRLAIARDLFQRQETRELSPQQDYAVLRRSLDYALNDAGRALGVVARQIGGVRTLRDFPGSGREPLTPVSAAVQRQALDLIASTLLAEDGLQFSAALQRRLAPDYLARAESGDPTTDYQLPQRLLGLQRAGLAFLMNDGLAVRVLNSSDKLDDDAKVFSVAEIYARVLRDVWSDLPARGAVRTIPAARRELQRDHVNRLALAVLRPNPQARVESRSLAREQARTLLARLDGATRRASPATDLGTRSHLADAADTLRQALSANLVRQGL
jgi:hypothetical protein